MNAAPLSRAELNEWLDRLTITVLRRLAAPAGSLKPPPF
jgi:hypothetical protein